MLDTKRKRWGALWERWLPLILVLAVFPYAYSRQPAKPSYLIIVALLSLPFGFALARESGPFGKPRSPIPAMYAILAILVAGWASYGARADMPHLIGLQGACGMVIGGLVTQIVLERVLWRPPSAKVEGDTAFDEASKRS